MTLCVHVTHEAVQQSGGISAVLRGLITARAYNTRVERTLLLGPLPDPEAGEPLGADARVLYDSGRDIRHAQVSPALDGIAAHFGVRLVYGTRRWVGDAGTAEAEVLLVDVQHAPAGLDRFKFELSAHFGIDSRRYEATREYEDYVRLAEPGYEGIRALLGDGEHQCWILAHEFMGMGTVLKCLMMDDGRLRTAFYAHEVATARMLVENSSGRDLMFYNVLRLARRSGSYLEDLFGPQDAAYKHVLISQAWRCDAILAVGDWVVEELRFLGSDFARRDIALVYNGIPAAPIPWEAVEHSREQLRRYCAALLGYRPQRIFTHVTRLVKSKGLWRDLLVLARMDAELARRRERAVLLVLATEAGGRPAAEIWRMADEYGWPLVHREGFPDLTPGELAFDLQVRRFNARAQAIRVVFVNQFGFDRDHCGESMPAEVSFADIRQGGEVEFSQSLYEPFGIAALEPLNAGAISVISDVCGCVGYLRRTGAEGKEGRVEGAYTHMTGRVDIDTALGLDSAACAGVEERVSAQVARTLLLRLPADAAARRRLLRSGHQVAEQMSWEQVVTDYFLPALGLH